MEKGVRYDGLNKEEQIKYIKWLKTYHNLKQNTIEYYVSLINLFMRKSEYGNGELTIDNIRAFLFDRKKGEQVRDAYTRRFAIIKWCEYKNRKDLIEKLTSLFKTIRAPPPRHIKDIDFAGFKDFLDNTKPDMHILLMCMYDTGARITALLKLKAFEIRKDERGVFLFLHEKRGETIKRYIDSKTAILLMTYAKTYKPNDNIFIREPKKSIIYNYRGMWQELKNDSRKYYQPNNKVFGISFHYLRSGRAKEYYKKYKDLLVVKNFLNHKDIRTTLRYIDQGEDFSTRVPAEKKW